MKDGKQDGLLTDWFENGQKMQEENYKDSKSDGLLTNWWKNEVRGRSFKTARCTGFDQWYESGQRCRKKYENGELHGLWTEWHEDGTNRAP